MCIIFFSSCYLEFIEIKSIYASCTVFKTDTDVTEAYYHNNDDNNNSTLFDINLFNNKIKRTYCNVGTSSSVMLHHILLIFNILKESRKYAICYIYADIHCKIESYKY